MDHVNLRVDSITQTYNQWINVGKNSFMWLGPYPRVHITDPEQLKAAFSQYSDFQKPTINPLVGLLFDGLINHEGAQWAKHRKIINPAFHFEKLKVCFSLPPLLLANQIKIFQFYLLLSHLVNVISSFYIRVIYKFGQHIYLF